MENDFADCELSGREDLNLRPFGPETASGPSQTDGMVRKGAQPLQVGRAPESCHPSRSQKIPRILVPDLVPESGRVGAEKGGVDGPGWAGPPAPWLVPGAAPRVATTPTTLDLAVLYGGRGRLLRVAEVAEQLGVCNATVYRLCESGELPHLRVVNSIRVRPKDLAEYLAGGQGVQS